VSELNSDFWRRCSSCKNPIRYSSAYFVCSVSTCNRKRIGYVFDTVHCWERHLPGARHRDAAAVEAKSPTFQQWKAELDADGGPDNSPSTAPATPAAAPTSSEQAAMVAASRSPQRVISRPAGGSAPTPSSSSQAKPVYKDALESEILVVVSKLKSYVRERSEMNTSDSVSQVLSNRLRRLCDRAIDNARADGRKTLMDRDFENL
jgi:hypothetical protein